MLLSIKDFLKKFWGYLVTGVGIVIGLLIFKKRTTTYELEIEGLRSSHKKEIEDINNARDAERKQYEENERKFQEALKAIQKKYDDAKKDLDEKKKSDIKDIVVKYGNRPDILAQKLSEVTGFKIILPED